eukprot:326112-Amphidinium_carterae.2
MPHVAVELSSSRLRHSEKNNNPPHRATPLNGKRRKVKVLKTCACLETERARLFVKGVVSPLG